MILHETRIAVIGLGYVGLPLAAEFGKKYPTLGFDVNETRIEELREGIDRTGEVASLEDSQQLTFTTDPEHLRDCNVYIVAVPTPVDSDMRPDLTPLFSASQTVGNVITKGDVVIYESTVYPGATEEDCIPLVEQASGLIYNRDFFAGYSPERINPGDHERPLTRIVKVTSGSTPETARFVDELYSSIIQAGTYKATSIKVAEASKVVENTQRDVNIALINELSMVLSRLGIDTNEVINAASTKWNFMRLQPGLVGGHCIGVDPYYLLHRAARAGFVPDIIRTARQINSGMSREAVLRLVRAMTENSIPIRDARVLVMGATFKENCPDIRNTKVVELVKAMEGWGMSVVTTDPIADPIELQHEYGLVLSEPELGTYDVVVLAVPHAEFLCEDEGGLRGWLRPGGLLFDIKSALPRDQSDLRL
ncbi:nucleotide sugar dehydrogenase [Paracoccus sp. TK19116]|uniref:Nucleotide sugar dehydrogenase n=1 Tax=Paracoccus albicereus TaxID=2922394 RepID=A0ABT1MPB4_9RHOB|nr:nucleotide sugar dehydrogenase [Paracoccus albicereus]MCQ0970139.1 nucleotide sugar dehydrogenase [Paracoccus albicereus]